MADRFYREAPGNPDHRGQFVRGPAPLRFDLALFHVGSPDRSRRACFDVRDGDEDAEAILYRARPDDVAAIRRDDHMLIAALGGPRWASRQIDLRKRRRVAMQAIAGRLGAYLCDVLEKEEGWSDEDGS